MISLVLALFCIVGWISGALRPHRRVWVVIGATFGVPALVFYLWAVCKHITPDLGFDRQVGVHWLHLFFMIGGFIALLSRPNAPASRDDDQHDGAAHA